MSWHLLGSGVVTVLSVISVATAMGATSAGAAAAGPAAAYQVGPITDVSACGG